eukprot:TRINITY_DN88455_c0_g1_i1.p1 TRINITY_DN88455_c0_g1~~TRINITY_DN88455_c0_g1_i1.p1  ORF type:complete len:398 (+),score=72.95 TRINITY_DN88455_c0_g1_i1:135-1328(+)
MAPCCSRACIWLLSITGADAWWDQGHMLTAAVARNHLSTANAGALDAVLRSAGSDFANFSDVVSAAVWLDHMKCRDDQLEKKMPSCQGLATAPDFTILDSWHFVTIPYNSDNVSLSGLNSLFPFYKVSNGYWVVDAVSALENVDRTLRISGSRSTWTWNFMLRLLVHIMGDLHQPLHTTALYSEDFPTGDSGGNAIKLVDGPPPCANLHALWDGGGGQWARPWPIAKADLDAEVARITGKHPPENFVSAGRLSKDWKSAGSGYGLKDAKTFFEGIANDTNRFTHGVYAEYVVQRLKPGDRRTYHPSDAYLAYVKKVSDMQVALGGYRLAQWLQALQAHVPSAPTTALAPATRLDSSALGGAVVAGMALGAVLTVLMFKLSQRGVKQQPMLLAPERGI